MPTDHEAGEKNMTDDCIGRSYYLEHLNIHLDLSSFILEISLFFLFLEHFLITVELSIYERGILGVVIKQGQLQQKMLKNPKSH